LVAKAFEESDDELFSEWLSKQDASTIAKRDTLADELVEAQKGEESSGVDVWEAA
jgi:hypothetical protein